jgi:hypothetical protein
MEDRLVYQVGAWGAILGGVLAIVVNVLGPRPGSGSVGELRATVDTAATSGGWELTMVGIIVVSLLILLAFFALTRSFQDAPASGWGRLAWATALVGATIGIAAHAVYTGLHRGAGVMTADALDGVALVADGLFFAWVLTLFGATPLLYGLAMTRSHNYPTWLGWVTVIGGIVGLLAGFMHAFAGQTSTSVTLFAIGAGVFSLVIIYVGVLLLRQSSTVASLQV